MAALHSFAVTGPKSEVLFDRKTSGARSTGYSNMARATTTNSLAVNLALLFP
jgi:hypothetical protein